MSRLMNVQSWANILVLAVLLGATSVHGQQVRTAGNGAIRGQVLDSQHSALPGVTVTAKSLEAAGTQSAVTDGEGKYELSLLPGRVSDQMSDCSLL